MSTPQVKRAQERSDASKRQIIDAAVDVIAKRGIGKSTLKDIAEQAGVSSALLVFHFKSKDNLMRAVLGELRGVYAEGWRKALQPDNASAAQRLSNIMVYDLQFPLQHPKFLAAWYAFWGEAKGGLLYKGIGRVGDDECLNDINGLVEEIGRKNPAVNVDFSHVAEALYVMTFGHWHVAQLESERYDPQFACKTVFDYLQLLFPKEDWSILRSGRRSR